MRQAIAIQVAGMLAVAAGVWGLLDVWWFLLALGVEAFVVGLLLEHGARGKSPA